MKRPGAAWRIRNAQEYAAIRNCRVNDGWGGLWEAKMAA